MKGMRGLCVSVTADLQQAPEKVCCLCTTL